MNEKEQLFYIHKKNLSQIANICIDNININKILNDKISLILKTINENKKLIEKYLKLLLLPKNNLVKIIKSDFKLKNKEIQNCNLNLIKFNQNLKIKKLQLLDIITEKSNEKQEYENLLEQQFIIKNALIKKDNYINKFYNDLNYLITYPLFIEKKREYYLKDIILDNDMKDILIYYQNILTKKSKKFNKIHNEIISLENTIKNLKIEKKNINLNINTEEINSTENNIITTTINNLTNFNINDDNYNYSEQFSNDDNNSELNEINFEDNNFLFNSLNNKINIPKIDLKQIDFNKKKYLEEIMLSRDLNSNEDYIFIKNKIKLLKRKIKKYKIKIKIKQEKLRKYEEKIFDMKNFLIINEKNYIKEINKIKKNGYKSERYDLYPIIE